MFIFRGRFAGFVRISEEKKNFVKLQASLPNRSINTQIDCKNTFQNLLFSCFISIGYYLTTFMCLNFTASAGCKQFTSGRIIILQGITILQTIRRLFTVF